MDGIFAFCDSDELYATRFMEYFKKKRDIGFELTVFTSVKSLMNFLQDHFVEILLLGENTEITRQELNLANVRRIYRLADKTGPANDGGYSLINKYRMIQAIISDIKSDYVKHESNMSNKGTDRPEIVTIINPAHEQQPLVFTWSAGLQLSEQKRVLLISLELLPVRVISTVDYSDQPLTELIYYIKGNMDITNRQKALAAYQGSLAYLAGIASAADILSLTKEDVQSWITVLREQAEYEIIVFYADSNCEAVQELVRISDKTLVNSGKGLYSRLLYNEWLMQLERTTDKAVVKKAVKLTIPEDVAVNGLPLTVPELRQTGCWEYAKQQLDRFF